MVGKVKDDNFKPLTSEDRKQLGIPKPYAEETPKPLSSFLFGDELQARLEKNRKRRRRDALDFLDVERPWWDDD